MSPEEFTILQEVLWAFLGPVVSWGLILFIVAGLGVAVSDIVAEFLHSIQR